MKRYVMAAIVAPVLVLGGQNVALAQSGTTVETSPVSFTLTAETCQYLSPGTVIEGSGTQRSVTTTRTNRQGVVVVQNATHSSGTATDQDGNVYQFTYSNQFRVNESEPGLYTGRMTDHFGLAGAGPERLSNGFVANVTTNFETFSFDPIIAYGDPISFPEGETHCDPL